MIIIAMAACATVVLSFAALMAYSGLAIRQIAVERQTRMIQHVVERRTMKILQEVTSIAVWTEAYEMVGRRQDAVWIDKNFGVYLHNHLGHDLTMVYNAQDVPIYGSRDGASTAPQALAGLLTAAQPVVGRVRAREAARMRTEPAAYGFSRNAVSGGVLRIGERLYIVQASTIVPEYDDKGALRPRHPILLSAVELGPDFLANLTADFAVDAPRFAPPSLEDEAKVLLRDPSGAPVAEVAWAPERPGLEAFLRIKWILLGASALILVLLFVLVRTMVRLVRELRQAREDAFAASRAKSEFLANISHEIRTPLNGVLGMAQAMSIDRLSPTQRDRLTVIRESGSTLLALLNDVLDISKIQAGKLEIETATFNLDHLCRVVCATFQGLAAAKDLRLAHHLDTGDYRYWEGDALRIRQVLSNLISNAVKFTPQGSVTLSVASTPTGLAFSVTDTGVGLSDEQMSRLFQKFSQADASTTRRHGGSGLGLAICHDLVRLMGGALEVSSRVGEGSTFSFVLPLSPKPDLQPLATAEGGFEAPGARALRVLAAEDNTTNQLVLRALLQPLEVDLHIVADGSAAVRAFQEHRFDVVLMDVQMPEMNGVEATRAIRRHEEKIKQPRTPIIALSANVMTHHLAEYRSAGMDGHLGKPIEIERLYKMLEAVAAGALPEFEPAM